MARHRIHMLPDRSGSMDAYREATIEAVNGYLATLRADPLAADTLFSLTTFDSEGIDAVRTDQPAKWVRDIQAREFEPRAATPLYDAVGHILDIESRVPVDGRRAIVVITDGEENGSTRLSAARLEAAVKARQHEGWIFLYLGANQDAFAQAAKIGVPKERALGYRARSGASAAAAFAAAAAVSFAYFAMNPGDVAASIPEFSVGDRRAAFDGEQDWQAAMENDIAGAPSEPAALTSADPGTPPIDGDEKSTSLLDGDNEPVALDPDAGGSIIENIVEGVVDGVGSILGSIFD
jgi:hypothetical protein